MELRGSSAISETLDEALEVLAPTGPWYLGGLVNHGPMVAEALVRLDQPSAAVPWTVRYREQLDDAPAAANPLPADGWRDALGAAHRYPEWLALFRAALGEDDWRQVLRLWLPRLMPGFAADALHGVIWVGHAARALEERGSVLRVDNLARGLALWGATFEPLPGSVVTSGGGRPSTAIRQVERLPHDERATIDTIVRGVASAGSRAGFERVIGLVDPSADPSATLSDVVSTFAGVARERAHDWLSAVALAHGVTGPAALELLFPHLEREPRVTAVRYAWHAAAGVYSAFAGEPQRIQRPAAPSVESLVDRAVVSGDEHAVKFVEACLRGERRGREPFVSAGARVVQLLASGSAR